MEPEQFTLSMKAVTSLCVRRCAPFNRHNLLPCVLVIAKYLMSLLKAMMTYDSCMNTWWLESEYFVESKFVLHLSYFAIFKNTTRSSRGHVVVLVLKGGQFSSGCFELRFQCLVLFSSWRIWLCLFGSLIIWSCHYQRLFVSVWYGRSFSFVKRFFPQPGFCLTCCDICGVFL